MGAAGLQSTTVQSLVSEPGGCSGWAGEQKLKVFEFPSEKLRTSQKKDFQNDYLCWHKINILLLSFCVQINCDAGVTQGHSSMGM